MVFTEEEYEVLEKILLESQYVRYKQMKELIEFAEELQTNKLTSTTIENLP